jgi:membrane protein
MKQKFSRFFKLLKDTYKGWNADDPFRQSAVIAYYAIFSLPALLVLIINVVGFFFEKEAINGEISRQIEGVMGADTAEQVEGIVTKASEMKAGVLSTIIAIVTIIFGATGVFVQLQKTLNQIWDVKQREDLSFIKQMKGRLFSFGLIISIGFLMLVSLVMSSFLAAASHWLKGIFPDAIAYLFYALEFVVSFGVISTMFALMFRYLPDAKIKWKDVWVGAFLTSGLFILGKYGLSFYFGKSEPASVYGAAGSIILILLWVSYSSMIVFFGAEFTKHYTLAHGDKIVPTKDAVKIDGEMDEHQKTKSSEAVNETNKLTNNSYSQNGHSKNGHTTEKHGWSEHKHGHKFEEHELKLHSKINENVTNEKGIKMKNRKELQLEIEKLELRLKEDKRDIKDTFTWMHIFGGIIPRFLRIKHKTNDKMSFNDVVKNVARNHISLVKKDETILDKIKKLIHND